MQPILSVLVISFNQRDLLNRCFQSLLAQKIRVPWEIVLSDALSHDGTYELAEEYAAKYNVLAEKPNKDGFYSPEFVPVHCDTDEGNAQNRTECCGWMKLTAYLHARGKYFVNIDADDYLKHDDIYQMQIDMLESHPECSVCMQGLWTVNDGEPIESGHQWPDKGHFEHGQILNPQDIIYGYRVLNQCYMIRHRNDDDMKSLYGKFFDDSIITLHHLQYGPAIYVDRADYVWVQYRKSISNSIRGDGREAESFMLTFHHARKFPMFAELFMDFARPFHVKYLKKLIKNNFHLEIDEQSKISIRNIGRGYMCKFFLSSSATIFDKVRIMYMYAVVLVSNRYHLKNEKYIYSLMVDKKEANEIFGKN